MQGISYLCKFRTTLTIKKPSISKRTEGYLPANFNFISLIINITSLAVSNWITNIWTTAMLRLCVIDFINILYRQNAKLSRKVLKSKGSGFF